MKKWILATLLLWSVAHTNSFGQTTATDFTTNDCAGVSHHLFGELDAGNIIVLVFVMPCVGCIQPAIDTRTVVGNYAATHPGKVTMYLVDDDAATPCSTMYSWRNSNGIGLVTTFSSPDVVQTQYGTPGMPKIVVLGGSNHHIFYNVNNSVDTAQLRTAIDAAIVGVTSTPDMHRTFAATLSPNPAHDKLTLPYEMSAVGNVRADIYDVTGRRIETIIEEQQPAGQHLMKIDIAQFPTGSYILKLRTVRGEEAFKFLVER